jgi:hypothetical protein
MLAISDARFIDALAAEAKSHGKLAADFKIPDAWRRHQPEGLKEALAKPVRKGLMPPFPFGSDFTEVEQRLLPALEWLKSSSANWKGRWRLLEAALRPGEPRVEEAAALERMGLMDVTSLGDRLQRRLLQVALRRQ